MTERPKNDGDRDGGGATSSVDELPLRPRVRPAAPHRRPSPAVDTDRPDARDDHDPLSAELAAARAALGRYGEDIRRLNEELAKARQEIEWRDVEMNARRSELAIVRAVSDKLRDSVNRSLQAAAEPGRISRLMSLFNGLALIDFRRRQRQIRAQAEAIRKAGVFDSAWYLKRYPDVAEAGHDPLLHYLNHGAGEARDPHPLFDSNWYRSTYPEVKSSGLSPLGHFVSVGATRCYDPHPLFHTAWYVAQNPDVAAAGINPLRHYMAHGHEKGRNPNPLFDSAWYLDENPDVRDAGENPLCHYIHHGIAELRDPHPLFDTQWYVERYEYVVAAGIDALEHYLTVGIFEGCRPGPDATEEAARERRRAPRRPRAQSEGWTEIDPATGDGTGAKPSTSPTDIMGWQMRLEANGVVEAEPRFTGQIGVFVHLYYEDLAEEIAASLLVIPFDFKVYVSTNNQAKKHVIEATFRRFGIEPVIKIAPNRGWDIAPFLLGFVDEMRAHEICLKLHGKNSRHHEAGPQWRNYLFSGLLGDRRNVTRIVGSFVAHPELGVLMMPHWRGVARRAHVIGANYQHMRALLRRAGLSISSDQRIEFPSGSMFWFRGPAMAPLLELGLTWFDFQGCRPRNLDATIAHAVERCILIFAAMAGYKWAYLPKRWLRWSWNLPQGLGRTRAPLKIDRAGPSR